MRVPTRVEYLRHAEDLAHFAQSIELGSDAVGREVVAAHFDEKRKEARTCYNCGKVGYVQADLYSKGRNGGGKPNNASGDGSMALVFTEKRQKGERDSFHVAKWRSMRWSSLSATRATNIVATGSSTAARIAYCER